MLFSSKFHFIWLSFLEMYTYVLCFQGIGNNHKQMTLATVAGIYNYAFMFIISLSRFSSTNHRSHSWKRNKNYEITENINQETKILKEIEFK